MRSIDPPRSGSSPLPPRGAPPAAWRSQFRGGRWIALSLSLALLALDARAVEPPTPQQVREATEAVYNDPDLHGLKADRELRFKDREQPKEPEAAADMRWLRDLVRWFSQAGRWLMWLGMAALVALLIVYLRRWIAVRGDALAGRALTLPSHVRDLDIRPQSLPDDLPAAVRALWQRGESRAALSLLYRGALSRLVHDHAVPVRAASTEGECATLAARHLDAERGAFVARLIGLWQLAVYGARLPDGSAVMAVCDEFNARLPKATAAARATT
jgi:Domain of unknown function (DUF4129)